jgi:DNA adenine methylase
LQFYNKSYDEVKIKPNSIIYCDPPYIGTAEYDDPFDHQAFYDWCDRQESPVFVSEYEVRDKRLVPIFKINKRSNLGGKKQVKVEKLFANRAAVAMLRA